MKNKRELPNDHSIHRCGHMTASGTSCNRICNKKCHQHTSKEHQKTKITRVPKWSYTSKNKITLEEALKKIRPYLIQYNILHHYV